MKNDLHHRLGEWAIEKPLFPSHMTFIVGPRQSGKTTLALAHLKTLGLPKEDYYFNWDRPDIRRKFQGGLDWISQLSLKKRPTLIFDEIHKARGWKRLLKGIYDQYKNEFHFVVTGSGRLDLYQRGGDSLAGRYDSYFLLPFTPGEIDHVAPARHLTVKELLEAKPLGEELISQWESLGGFPEPFLCANEAKAKRWWAQYQARVTEEDLRDLTQLESVDLMRNILQILPERIGNPLSIQSIRENVETSFATSKRYLSTLNQLFLTFEIAPYSKKIHRAVKKERKTYFFHHPAVLEAGPRFENMIAILLKRWVSEKNERAEGDFDLFYIRDQDRREVDFLITKDRNPFFLFEAKLSDTTPSSALRFYSERLGIPGVQVVRTKNMHVRKDKELAVISIHHLAAVLG